MLQSKSFMFRRSSRRPLSERCSVNPFVYVKVLDKRLRRTLCSPLPCGTRVSTATATTGQRHQASNRFGRLLRFCLELLRKQNTLRVRKSKEKYIKVIVAKVGLGLGICDTPRAGDVGAYDVAHEDGEAPQLPMSNLIPLPRESPWRRHPSRVKRCHGVIASPASPRKPWETKKTHAANKQQATPFAMFIR